METFIINNPVASNLSANTSTQLYTIEVVDINGANEGCVSTRAYTLLHQPTTVYLLSPQLSIAPQTICGPNGEITIDEIFEDDPNIGTSSTSAPYTGVYNAQLLESDLTPSDPTFSTFNPATGSFEDGSGNTQVIPAGTYYVRAQDITTGCAYGPLTQVIIQDVSKNPIVSATLDSPDYACIGGTNTGMITPTVLGGTDNDTYPNFTINWYHQGTLSSPMTDNGGGTYEDRAINLAAGVYTIEVIDNAGADQNCVTTRDYVVTAARHNIDIIASGTDQTICIADGSIQIDDVQVNAVSEVDPHLNWTALLYDNTNNPVAPAPAGTGFNSNSDPFTGIAAGTYLLRAQDNLTQCFSDPYQVVLDDLSEDPVIDIGIISPQYSLNPNPASWTGEMQASVVETNGIPDPGGYALAWHVGLGTTNPSFSVLDNVSMVDEGLYTFVSTNNNTGCTSNYYVYMPYEYLEPTFNTSIKAKTICSPEDGGIEVTDIALDAVPDQLSDYTFDFHHDHYNQGDVADQVIPGNDVRTAYDDINSGSYYIIAKENWWWVESYPVKVDVIDSTTNPIITFDVANYQPLTSCDPSVYADGALAVNVYEDLNNPNLSPPYVYSYAWYTGENVDPSNVITDSTSNAISNLPAGEYTVHVINQSNFCESAETFTIEDASVIPIAKPTMTPVTNCPIELANGIVTAQVINSVENFEYLWYAGSETQATPDFVGDIWYNKAIGNYTVVAVDQQFGTCISEPVVIAVEDATVKPTILISEIHPITNCDPAKPNATVSASADGGVSGYTFDWYEDGQLYFTGPIASNLGSAIYQVVVTNDVTQCSSTRDVIPSVLFDIIPPPEVTILSEMTSCLEPNGEATATVEGNIKDYIFKYYKKHDDSLVENEFVDNVIYDLDTSTYLVTAENRVTGCISEPTEFAISNEQYYPEIDVIADPSDCQEPNGSANVILSDMTRDFKVTWIGDNGFEAQEKEIVYIPVGKYTVEVEGTDGCVSTAEAEVKGDVIIYNGVSANYDGLNDFFAIVCLEYFPDNNVKIYNRAGLLVYEQDFYDMNDPSKRFEGISNKGASIIGTELPIGTYFYVVDKNDGTKAKVGYLELNR